jgi:hypothetical protein
LTTDASLGITPPFKQTVLSGRPEPIPTRSAWKRARPAVGGDMRRTLAIGWVGALLFAGGCATGPLQENPLVIRPAAKADVADNPVYVPLGPNSYAAVFEKVLDVIGDYNFEIAYSNRYDGRIETFPKISPGLGQPWKGGSPDFHQRLVATFQSIRHRAIVLISPANDGGYFIDVKVYKELLDTPRPQRATAGAAVFRSDPTLERQYEVVEADQFENGWVPIGRDCLLEQSILEQLARFDPACNQPTPCATAAK